MDETQNNQADQQNQNQNGASLPSELEDIKAQLAAEQAARTEAEGIVAEKDACITERDARIAELQTSLNEAKIASEAKDAQIQTSAAELATVTEARDEAVGKYLGMAKALNPAIPETIITGATIAEIDASIEKAKGIVEAVKSAMAADASNAKVPAGAPTRGGISTDGMTAREKIAAGIQPKGEI